jgi:hypothetical protein
MGERSSTPGEGHEKENGDDPGSSTSGGLYAEADERGEHDDFHPQEPSGNGEGELPD